MINEAEDLLQEDFKAIPTRRSLLPVWVRIFISVIVLEGILAAIMIVFALMSPSMELWMWSFITILLIHGISAVAMILERKWAIFLCFGITVLVLAVLTVLECGWIYNDLVLPGRLHLSYHLVLSPLIFLHLALVFKLGGMMREWREAVSGTKLFYE